MIALIYYNIGSSINYEELFNHWLQFYHSSKTNLPFQIFGLIDGPNKLHEYSVHNILKHPSHVEPQDTTFSDCLRSQLFKIVQTPFIYMDLDCLILQPVDSLLGTISPLGMSPSSAPIPKCFPIPNWYNSGVLVITKDIEDAYNTHFNEQEYLRLRNDENNNVWARRVYGQYIWSLINNYIGEALPKKWNQDITELNANTCILHPQRGRSLKWTPNAIKELIQSHLYDRELGAVG